MAPRSTRSSTTNSAAIATSTRSTRAVSRAASATPDAATQEGDDAPVAVEEPVKQKRRTKEEMVIFREEKARRTAENAEKIALKKAEKELAKAAAEEKKKNDALKLVAALQQIKELEAKMDAEVIKRSKKMRTGQTAGPDPAANSDFGDTLQDESVNSDRSSSTNTIPPATKAAKAAKANPPITTKKQVTAKASTKSANLGIDEDSFDYDGLDADRGLLRDDVIDRSPSPALSELNNDGFVGTIGDSDLEMNEQAISQVSLSGTNKVLTMVIPASDDFQMADQDADDEESDEETTPPPVRETLKIRIPARSRSASMEGESLQEKESRNSGSNLKGLVAGTTSTQSKNKRKLYGSEAELASDNSLGESTAVNGIGKKKQKLAQASTESAAKPDDSGLKTAGSRYNWRENIKASLSISGTAGKTKFLSPAAAKRRSVSPSGDCSSRALSCGPGRETSAEPGVELVGVRQAGAQTPTPRLPDILTSVPRVTKMTPLQVKSYESVDERKPALPGATGSSKQKSEKSSEPITRVTMLDVKVDHRRFSRRLVPTFNDYMMSQPDPFDVHNEKVLEETQKMYDAIFPYDSQRLTEDCPIMLILIQRFMEYRRRYVNHINKKLKEHFEKPEHSNEEYIIQYVNSALNNVYKPDFVWRNFTLDGFTNADVKKGLMRSEFIIEALSHHMHETRNAFEDAPSVKEGNYPLGAMVIAGVAHERSLKLWGSGTYNKAKASVSFSADNFSKRIKVFSAVVASLKDDHWLLILKDASEAACKLSGKAGDDSDEVSDATAMEEPVDNFDPSTMADEDEDSELEALRANN